MGLGLRFSPLEWNSNLNAFDFGNARVMNLLGNGDFTPHNFYVNKRARSSRIGSNVVQYTKRDGMSWNTPFATIAEAITAARALISWGDSPWGIGGVIHIAPGSYAENLTALPHGFEMRGYGDCWDADGETGVRIKPASGSPVDVGGFVNARVININFESTDTSRCFDGGEVNNVLFEHCRFAGAPEATDATAGLYMTKTVQSRVHDCLFQYLDCGIDVVYTNSGDTMVRLNVWENIMSYITEAGIRFGAANLLTKASAIFRNVMYGGGVTLALGVDDNSGDDNTMVAGNLISATAATEGVSTHTVGNFTGGSTIA